MSDEENLKTEVESPIDAKAEESIERATDFVEKLLASNEITVAEFEVIKENLQNNTVPQDLPQEAVQEAAAKPKVTIYKQVVREKTEKEIYEEKKEYLIKEKKGESVDLRQILSKASMAEKVKLALFGNSACRALLIMDPNPIFQAATLKNPRIQLIEIEAYTKNPFMPDLVLGMIAESRTWSSSYTVKKNLVFNPKTPPHASLKFVRFMQRQDLRTLARSKQVPQLVAVAARRKMEDLNRKR
jgi:hypothetical protein